MPKIIVQRNGNMVNALMSYSLSIDGLEQPIKISNNAIREFQLPAGNHTISLRSVWFKSRPCEFNIGENETKIFHANIPPGMQAFIVILSILLVAALRMEIHDMSSPLTGVLIVVTLVMTFILVVKRNDLLTITNVSTL